MIRCMIFACVLVVLPVGAMGKVVGRAVPYEIEGKPFEGYLAYDDEKTGKRPGVLVVHEWWGVNAYAKKRAEMLAGLGYVAFAGDMYGKGIVTDDPKRAGELAGELRGKPELTRRARAALDVLAHDERVDAKRLAAIGYCFGGSTALQLAYSGAELAGIVSFHGGLVYPTEHERETTHARLLILTGGADPMVPLKDFERLQQSLDGSKVDWQVVIYSGAKHSFTNPAAARLTMPGVGYDEKADHRSWEQMRGFFDEIFAGKSKKNG